MIALLAPVPEVVLRDLLLAGEACQIKQPLLVEHLGHHPRDPEELILNRTVLILTLFDLQDFPDQTLGVVPIFFLLRGKLLPLDRELVEFLVGLTPIKLFELLDSLSR